MRVLSTSFLFTVLLAVSHRSSSFRHEGGEDHGDHSMTEEERRGEYGDNEPGEQWREGEHKHGDYSGEHGGYGKHGKHGDHGEHGDHGDHGDHHHGHEGGGDESKWEAMMTPDLLDDMPSPFDKAATARWLTHNIDWGVLSTINSREREGTPFGNVASFSDGAPGASTGNLYFLHSPLDASMKDIAEDDSIGFTMSEVQTGYCQAKKYDAEDPRCARLSLSGRLIKIDDDDKKEVEIASTALFAKHPSMRDWYQGGDGMHDFGFWKLEIEEIWLISFFGGATVVTPEAWERGTDKEGETLFPSVMKSCHDKHPSSTVSSSESSPSIMKGGTFHALPFVAAAIIGVLLGFAVGCRQSNFRQTKFQKIGTELVLEMEDDIKTVPIGSSLT